METWWYITKNQKTGPVSVESIISLALNGTVDLNTLLWKKGMESWLPLHKIDELQVIQSMIPPPVPNRKENVDTYFLASRWRRYFARMFDTIWETLFVSYVLGFLLGPYSPFTEWILKNSISNPIAVWLLYCPIVLVVDAIIYKIFGNTPGKYILCIIVVQNNNLYLNFRQYLMRNLSLWMSGLAFGFPIINLFTMMRQAIRLGENQQASYDVKPNHQVKAKKIGWIRRVIFTLIFLILFFLIPVLKQYNPYYNSTVDIYQHDYLWVNPVTHKSARIDSHWERVGQSNTHSNTVYAFSERAGRALFILDIETAPTIFTLEDYVHIFLKSKDDTMHFIDEGQYFEKLGNQVWQCYGYMTAISTDNRIHIQIIKVKNNFLRIITIQKMPFKDSEELVLKMQKELWKTIL